ncbi:hypothetical protein GYMLUDRAFT_77790 [Collybiopsis luxurians FD-317 M1]|uniref:Mid2 domain-containing protein n=1 Tax=Collybiopsis luxurians FD-317 M1 TaxID=944289 RepID=A0A0D0CC60_9AGAR|nr:hypothetical protein GYMLUDRAFT_77790 [Collybiopsis luxurians FD-317 M1]
MYLSARLLVFFLCSAFILAIETTTASSVRGSLKDETVRPQSDRSFQRPQISIEQELALKPASTENNDDRTDTESVFTMKTSFHNGNYLGSRSPGGRNDGRNGDGNKGGNGGGDGDGGGSHSSQSDHGQSSSYSTDTSTSSSNSSQTSASQTSFSTPSVSTSATQNTTSTTTTLSTSTPSAALANTSVRTTDPNIAAIVLCTMFGTILLVILLLILVFVLLRRRKRLRSMDASRTVEGKQKWHESPQFIFDDRVHETLDSQSLASPRSIWKPEVEFSTIVPSDSVSRVMQKGRERRA